MVLNGVIFGFFLISRSSYEFIKLFVWPPKISFYSAENIKVQTEGSEIQKTGGKDSQYFDMFKEMNKDLLSLDSAIETLTTPGLKVNPRQLLALQAGVANTTIMAEGFSRFTDAISRGIQTIVQTQVG